MAGTAAGITVTTKALTTASTKSGTSAILLFCAKPALSVTISLSGVAGTTPALASWSTGSVRAITNTKRYSTCLRSKAQTRRRRDTGTRRVNGGEYSALQGATRLESCNGCGHEDFRGDQTVPT